MTKVAVDTSGISPNGPKRSHTTSSRTQPEDRAQEINRVALDHAWDWFALHARQRMQCVNFFLVAVAFLATAYGTALTKDLHGLAVGICVLGVLISHCFHRLDQRTRDLVEAGREAIKPLQQRLAHAASIEDLEILKRVEREKQEKKGTSYSAILRMVHWATILAFLVGGVYALYLAGVRPCLTV